MTQKTKNKFAHVKCLPLEDRVRAQLNSTKNDDKQTKKKEKKRSKVNVADEGGTKTELIVSPITVTATPPSGTMQEVVSSMF
jgi:hypothetical protein